MPIFAETELSWNYDIVLVNKIPRFVFSVCAEPQSELPDSRSMRVENKMFYFDVGSNRRGVYLRVSEVRCGLLCSGLKHFHPHE